MDPNDPEAQARALAASRRILARIRRDISESAESPAPTNDEDRTLLAGDSEESFREDLRIFARWHDALGTDPEAVLTEMRSRARQEARSN